MTITCKHRTIKSDDSVNHCLDCIRDRHEELVDEISWIKITLLAIAITIVILTVCGVFVLGTLG